MIFGLVRASVENTVTVSGDKSVKWMSNYCEGKIIARIGCLQKFLNTLWSHSINHSEKSNINYELFPVMYKKEKRKSRTTVVCKIV